VEMGTEEGRCGHTKDTVTSTSVANRALGSDQGLVGSMDTSERIFDTVEVRSSSLLVPTISFIEYRESPKFSSP